MMNYIVLVNNTEFVKVNINSLHKEELQLINEIKELNVTKDYTIAEFSQHNHNREEGALIVVNEHSVNKVEINELDLIHQLELSNIYVKYKEV